MPSIPRPFKRRSGAPRESKLRGPQAGGVPRLVLFKSSAPLQHVSWFFSKPAHANGVKTRRRSVPSVRPWPGPADPLQGVRLHGAQEKPAEHRRNNSRNLMIGTGEGGFEDFGAEKCIGQKPKDRFDQAQVPLCKGVCQRGVPRFFQRTLRAYLGSLPLPPSPGPSVG